MPSASRLFALLYLFSPPGKEEENGEKRRGKGAARRVSGARRLLRSEGGGEVRVAARSLAFSFFFF